MDLSAFAYVYEHILHKLFATDMCSRPLCADAPVSRSVRDIPGEWSFKN